MLQAHRQLHTAWQHTISLLNMSLCPQSNQEFKQGSNRVKEPLHLPSQVSTAMSSRAGCLSQWAMTMASDVRSNSFPSAEIAFTGVSWLKADQRVCLIQSARACASSNSFAPEAEPLAGTAPMAVAIRHAAQSSLQGSNAVTRCTLFLTTDRFYRSLPGCRRRLSHSQRAIGV